MPMLHSNTGTLMQDVFAGHTDAEESVIVSGFSGTLIVSLHTAPSSNRNGAAIAHSPYRVDNAAGLLAHT